ncbi:MAG: hypothetical protein HOI95_06925 [Chromatiales bacterium]|jgi:4-hydroxybenzoyl-CoA thioesterase|nr:hypothetical protein [Chromatiales bacterium]
MINHSRALTVSWGESDPFGLVYFPMMLAWFNDTEHELLRALGFGTEALIARDRCAFVMGDIRHRFVGTAGYGDVVQTSIELVKMTNSTLHWECKAWLQNTGKPVTEGLAIRVFARIRDDGGIDAQSIPQELRDALSHPGPLRDVQQTSTLSR